VIPVHGLGELLVPDTLEKFLYAKNAQEERLSYGKELVGGHTYVYVKQEEKMYEHMESAADP
jgi:hypothetical protein